MLNNFLTVIRSDLGILIAIIAAILATSKDIVSKKLSSSLSGTASTFASFAYALPFYLILIPLAWATGYEQFSVGQNFIFLVFLRSLSDAAAEWLKMTSFTYADVSFLVPFMSVGILFVSLLSPTLTGDQISTPGYCGIFLIFIGCLAFTLEIKKQSINGKKMLIGALFALGSSFFFAVNGCIDRLAANQASPLIAGFSVTFVAALLFLPAILKTPTALTAIRMESKQCLLRGIFETFFMIAKYAALVFLPIHIVSGVMKSSLLFTIIGGNTILGEREFLRRFIAGIFIFIGIILLVLYP